MTQADTEGCMPDEINTRLSRAEWEIEALKEEQSRQAGMQTELSTRIDVHHKEVMEAIGSLRDDRARNQGASDARMRMLRWLTLGLGAVGTLIALGWINTSEAAWLPVDAVADAPIYVQQYSRDVP